MEKIIPDTGYPLMQLYYFLFLFLFLFLSFPIVAELGFATQPTLVFRQLSAFLRKALTGSNIVPSETQQIA
ncbi:hypothetical protein SAMN05216419_10178 [Nitrosomonas cryotolerans]|nr:hypothetical protein SAMN05216419_10178 [Nitrosomonas cryotolerans]